MKTILIPTDFSENAEHAILYALTMNKFFNAKIILFHSYFIPVYTTDIPVSIPDGEEIERDSMKALEKLKEKIKKMFPEIHLKLELITSEGLPDDEIISVAEKKKIDLVVMGTKGAGGLKELLIGTTTGSVMEKINCPVIAVPKEASFREIKKIVYATNYAEIDLENIEEVIDMARRFDAEVILLHIATGHLVKSFEFSSIEGFEQRIKEESGYDKLSFKLIESNDVVEGVSNYLDEIKADLIAMTSRHRTLFQKLFDRSSTKKMVNHTHIPLLLFHVKERGNYLL